MTTAGVAKHNIGSIVWSSPTSFFLVPIHYTAALVASKGAILSLYLNIFPLGIELRITQGVAIIIIVHRLVGILMIIFQCNPVSNTWNTLFRPNCLDTRDLFEYNCLPNVITNLIMLALPIPTVWSLNASKRLKVGLSIMLFMASM